MDWIETGFLTLLVGSIVLFWSWLAERDRIVRWLNGRYCLLKKSFYVFLTVFVLVLTINGALQLADHVRYSLSDKEGASMQVPMMSEKHARCGITSL